MTFLYVLLGILVIILLLVLIAPKKYMVERSVVISKPIDEVFTYLTFIKNQDDWSPWKRRDPEMKQRFIGNDGENGFISVWESSHKNVGSGEQEIIKIDRNNRIETEIRFSKPWKSQSIGFFTTEAVDSNATKVTWGFYGDHKIPLNILMLFLNMDKAVGKDFDEGLSRLKNILENK